MNDIVDGGQSTAFRLWRVVCVATSILLPVYLLWLVVAFVAEAAEVQRRLGILDAGPDPPFL